MNRKHFTITQNKQGQPIQTPLRSWIRQNLSQYPNLDPDQEKITTGHIRRALVKAGWHTEESMEEVFVIKPDNNGMFDYAMSLIDTIEEEENYNLEESDELTFTLEKDLQAALRKNIGNLSADFVIIDGGIEKNTEAGRIDITAKDKNGDIVVIELKAGKAKPEVIAQILAYVSAIKKEGHSNVRGIIIAQEFSDRVKLAAESLSFIELMEYSFQFTFKKI